MFKNFADLLKIRYEDTNFRYIVKIKFYNCIQFYENHFYFFRIFFSKPPYWIPASTKLNCGDGFEKSILENSSLKIKARG